MILGDRIRALVLVMIFLVTGCTPSVHTERMMVGKTEDRQALTVHPVKGLREVSPYPTVNRKKAQKVAAVIILVLLHHSNSAPYGPPYHAIVPCLPNSFGTSTNPLQSLLLCLCIFCITHTRLRRSGKVGKRISAA